MLGLVQADRGRHLRRRQGRGGGAAQRRLSGQAARLPRATRRAAGRSQAGRRPPGRRSSAAGRTSAIPSRSTSRRLERHAPAADAARARAGPAGPRHGVDRHRQHLLGGQLLPALRAAALDVRGDELRQLRLRVPGHHRRQGRRARPPGVRLRRRRRLGHQLQRAPDLRARAASASRAVVFNNGQWGAEKKNHVDFYAERFVGVNLEQHRAGPRSPRPWARDGLRGRPARRRRPGAAGRRRRRSARARPRCSR